MRNRGTRATIVFSLFLIVVMCAVGPVSCGRGERNFNVCEYDKKFRTRFSGAFPVLARDILRQAKVDRGICIDIGCGPGYLGLEIAKNSTMTVHSLDILPEMITIVKKYVAEEKLTGRVHAVVGDVHNLPYESGFADLAVSRGSLPFWRDKAKAFGEIIRVLKSGGEAHIGCGFGAGYAHIGKRRNDGGKKPPKKFTHDEILEALEGAGIVDYTVIDDSLRGYWVIIRKQ